jgi:hypothetical protein
MFMLVLALSCCRPLCPALSQDASADVSRSRQSDYAGRSQQSSRPATRDGLVPSLALHRLQLDIPGDDDGGGEDVRRRSSSVRGPPPGVPFRREWTWWAHTGGGNALAFKQPPMRPGDCHPS